MLEDRVQEGDDVADGLRCEAGVEHRRGDRLDVAAGHAVDGLGAKPRRDVHTLHRLAVLQVGLARALDGKPSAQRAGRLVERVALGTGPDRAALLSLLELAELALGFGAGQRAGPGRADLAVELAAVERASASVVGAVLEVELTGSVSALGRLSMMPRGPAHARHLPPDAPGPRSTASRVVSDAERSEARGAGR